MTSPYPVSVTNFPPPSPAAIQPWFHWTQPDVTLVAAIAATAGWLWVSHRNRVAGRKQHTINVIMANESNDVFRKAEQTVSALLTAGVSVDLDSADQPVKEAFQLILNRYEFISAGIRNRDFDERLVSDTLRSIIMGMFKISEASILAKRARIGKPRQYEHLQWLHEKWSKQPIGWPRHRKWPWRGWNWTRWPWSSPSS